MAGLERISRRQALALAASAFAAAAVPGRAEDGPVIMRPGIEGVDPRYAAYATQGPFEHPGAPVSVRTSHSAVSVFAPRNARRARLVVFSHGALADPLTYRSLLWHWTSHGFVVAAPLHQDAVIESGPTLRTGGTGAYSQWPIATLLEDPEAWRHRVRACTAILDDLVLISAAAGIEIETDRVAIAGHGYGAYVASLVLGAEVKDSNGDRVDLADPRFFSGILMSPQGPGVMGLDERSWGGISAPLMFVVAENDVDFTGQPSTEKVKPFRLVPPGYKHMAYLHGGTANSFSGHTVGTNPREQQLFQAMRAVTTAYLRAYSDYDPEAFQDMTSNFFQRMTLGAISEGRR